MIHGTGPDDIFAFGSDSWHYDGLEWSPFTALNLANPVRDLFVTPRGFHVLHKAPFVPSQFYELSRLVGWDCTAPEDCSDGVDNDCDGLTDSADGDCTDSLAP